MLQSDNVYLLHSGSSVFLWVGRKAPLNKKREATHEAERFLKSRGLPRSTAVSRVSEGVESSAFKAQFAKWDVVVNTKRGIAEAQREEGVDVAALLGTLLFQPLYRYTHSIRLIHLRGFLSHT